MDPVLRRGLVNAFAIAACTTVLSLFLAAPLAMLSVRFEFPARRVLNGLGVRAMALLGLTLTAASILLGRRLGAMFRV